MSHFSRSFSIDEAGLQHRPYTPIYALLSSLDAYQRGSLSLDGLQAELDYTHTEISELHEKLAHPLLTKALEVLEAFEDSDREDFHQALKDLEPQLLSLNIAELTSRAERRKHHDRLQSLMDQPVPEDELLAGFYSEIEDQLGAWFDEEQENPSLFLQEHLDRVRAARHEYEATYIEESEWTMEVALADELLQHAYQSWMDGLCLLLESVEARSDDLAQAGLSLLLDGNHSFIKVSQLGELA